MDFLNVIILAVIEGFTEFLPISSTAHLMIASRTLGIEKTDFLKSFIISIQFGAILSVVFLYWKIFFYDWKIDAKIITAFIPTALIGFFLYEMIKGFFLESLATVAIALIAGGIFLIFFEKFHKDKSEKLDISGISYSKAFLIGCAQALAVIPGVSRATSTIIGGMLLGAERKTIVEFSFLLAVPTMLAATGYDLIKSGGAFTLNEFYLLALGFFASFVFAVVGIKFLLDFIKRKTFVSFGIYRIVIGLILLVYLYR